MNELNRPSKQEAKGECPSIQGRGVGFTSTVAGLAGLPVRLGLALLVTFGVLDYPGKVLLGADAASATTPVRRLSVDGTRHAFLNIIQKPAVPLNPEVKSPVASNGLERIHFSFSSDSLSRVPGVMVRKPGLAGRRPVIILMHGTGGTKDESGTMSWLNRFAASNFLAVAIDGRYHGSRTKAGKGTVEYYEAITKAYQTGVGHPFYYDTVWDAMKLVDYLASREDVDASRIGLMGISKGGIETYFTAAADPRIAVAVPCIGVQTFKWGIDNGQWKGRIATIQGAFDAAAEGEGVKQPGTEFLKKFYDKVVPGIYGEFDGPGMLPLIAPRPLLVINGDSDAHTPLAGVRKAVDSARPLYVAQNAADRLVLIIQENTGHSITRESGDAILAWFVKWLKP